MGEVTAWAPGSPSRARKTVVLASLPPLVKITSRRDTPSSAASRARSSSRAARAAWPKAWGLEGLPGYSASTRAIRSAAAGRMGAVALWSR